MDIHDLQTELNHWRERPDLLTESNLLARIEAIDFLTFINETIQMQHSIPSAAQRLQQEAQVLAMSLTKVNQALFAQVRTALQTQALRGDTLRTYLNQFTNYGTPAADGVYTSYDGLDGLVDGLFALSQAPAPTRTRETEMVRCEETPARVILDLLDHVGRQADDLFYDLGSGLGQVVMLVNLLTGMDACGVEYEPAYVDFARLQAATLNLANVSFINEDARTANYSEGTIFFLFTPFRGEMLQTILARLQEVAQDHPIQVCTFGSCTPRVAEQAWLRPCYGDEQHEYRLVIFESR